MISLQGIISALSLIVSSGAIGYAVRLVIKIEVLEHLFNEKKEDMDDLVDRQAASESDILRIKDSMARIDTSLLKVVGTCENLPSINERLGTILDKIGTFVPKAEIDGQMDRLRDRISDNIDKINQVDAKVSRRGRSNNNASE